MESRGLPLLLVTVSRPAARVLACFSSCWSAVSRGILTRHDSRGYSMSLFGAEGEVNREGSRRSNMYM